MSWSVSTLRWRWTGQIAFQIELHLICTDGHLARSALVFMESGCLCHFQARPGDIKAQGVGESRANAKRNGF